MQVHGFEFTPINDGTAYSVNLTDQVVVLSKADGDRVATESQNADEVRQAVLDTQAKSAKDWKSERSETKARSTRDEQAMETAHNAATGEAHEQSER